MASKWLITSVLLLTVSITHGEICAKFECPIGERVNPEKAHDAAPEGDDAASTCCMKTCALTDCGFGYELIPETLTVLPAAESEKETCCRVRKVDATPKFEGQETVQVDGKTWKCCCKSGSCTTKHIDKEREKSWYEAMMKEEGCMALAGVGYHSFIKEEEQKCILSEQEASDTIQWKEDPVSLDQSCSKTQCLSGKRVIPELAKDEKSEECCRDTCANFECPYNYESIPAKLTTIEDFSKDSCCQIKYVDVSDFFDKQEKVESKGTGKEVKCCCKGTGIAASIAGGTKERCTIAEIPEPSDDLKWKLFNKEGCAALVSMGWHSYMSEKHEENVCIVPEEEADVLKGLKEAPKKEEL